MKYICACILIFGAGLAMASSTAAPSDKTTTEATTMAATTTLATTAIGTTTIATTINATTTNATTPNATTSSAPTTELMTTTPMITTPMPPETMFRVNNSEGNACILEKIKALFIIKYNMTGGSGKTEIATMNFSLPENSVVDAQESMCGTNEMEPTMTLVFNDNGDKFVQFFTMSRNMSQLANISLSLKHTEALFPNSTQQGQLVNYTAVLPSTTFQVRSGNSYLCKAKQTFTMSDMSMVTFSRVQVQTGGIVNNTFGDASQCPQDNPSTTPMTTPTATPTPTPTPKPKPGNWNVTNQNGSLCMIMQMSLIFNISYELNTSKVNYSTIEIPPSASSANSVCSNKSATFVLTFFDSWSLTMEFNINASTKEYSNTIMSLLYNYDAEHFPHAKKMNQNATASTKESGIHAKEKEYYSCTTKSEISADNVTFILSDVKIQPFAMMTNGTLGDASPCPADSSFNNIVPIAVGCALAGLVIIVLIAYLIGRQRSSKSGYESV